MIQIFTPLHQLTEKQSIKSEKRNALLDMEPSAQVLQNILNYSKNLQVRPSRFVGFVETMQS